MTVGKTNLPRRGKKCVMTEVLKVSATSNPNQVAGAIAGSIRQQGSAEIQAIGAVSVLAICVILMSLSIQQEPGVIDGVALIAYGVLVLSGIILGPSTVAMTYVLRNYSNERHSFLMSDFFEHFKKNFKQCRNYGA